MIFELFEVEADWSIQPKPKRNDVRRTSDVLNYSLVMRDMNNTKPPSYSSAHDTFLLHKLVPIGRGYDLKASQANQANQANHMA